MKPSTSKILCLSVFISFFCAFNAKARNKIIPQNQMKMAPAVSQDLTPDQYQDNNQVGYQDGYQENFQENYQENYKEENFQNPADLAYLDQEGGFEAVAPSAKTEVNSAQFNEAQFNEADFQN